MNPDMSSPTGSYWCYRCTRFVRLSHAQDHIACPCCRSGFLEEIPINPSPSSSMSIFTLEPQNSFNLRRQGFRRRRRNAGSHSSFNPVIALRGPAHGGVAEESGDREGSGSFQLYYDDNDGSGLQPLPPNMSEFLLGSGFDQVLEQISQIENNGLGRLGNLPASKMAIGSMPTIEIGEQHVSTDIHCAICKEAFELGSKASEMPCKHIYHSDCIVPWLSMCNSCPVCRNELPSDRNHLESRVSRQIDEETIGFTIWRLPGGGFAVGRFPHGRVDGESHLPVVYTEMDGVVSANGVPRRVSRAMRNIRLSESRGLRRIFRSFLAFFGRLGSRSTSSSSSYSISQNGPLSGSLRQLSSVFNRNSQSRSRDWVVEDI
ncbi:E3 ubiquitin-protein ligase RDUF1-like [Prosopis cineraria]|uniref:E3 ubiquitin-protein ligase RDUF1-like n=1 Tax=Prosopis cineraria TaxID=364024 RepID=UPI002410219C|nr:E3 ubiquitin-protein ligase RDUF1-like [Prosopis cineraria]